METKDKAFESAQEYQIPSGSYDPNKNYAFTDKDGNTFYSKGDNGYVWEAITNGVPISVNDKGDWYVTPYLEVTPDKIVQHIPEWFKSTAEYDAWKNNYSSYLQPGINKDTFNQLNDILKSHGSQGYYRLGTYNLAKSYGITDTDLLDRSFQNAINLSAESQGVENPGITLYGETKSAADWAREIKGYSKEDLSQMMMNLQDTLSIGKGDKKGSIPWTGSREQQEAVMNALSLYQLLNTVDDNYVNFGDGKEFQGLLQASGLQKATALVYSANQGLLNSVAAVIPRLVHGLMSLGVSIFDDQPGLKFDANLSQYSDPFTSPEAGAGLEGTEGWVKAGGWIGNAENFVTMWGVSILAGGWVNGLAKSASASSAAVLSSLGTFMQTPVGSMVSDFFLHDIPIDVLNFFTVASENNWNWSKAWYDPENKQNLIAIPLVGDLIPIKVQAGLMNDIIGDAVVDLTLPILGKLAKVTSSKIDEITNGAATRFKESVALKNLALQKKLTDIPVIGTGWKKMINSIMGAENAAFIREARKTAIAEGSMDAYRRAQNILVIKNRGGGAEVFALYKKLLDGTGTLNDIKKFQKALKKYGGIGKTEVDWKGTKGGEKTKGYKGIDDVLPRQVKQGLLDIERLAELKGLQEKADMGDGGIIKNPAMQKEIDELQAKVDKLPQEIKDFADKMSEINKQVEQIAVGLGISNEDWAKAMALDPQFQKYMTRQALVPGDNKSGKMGSAESPAQINKSRKGYYAKNYIDPFVALNMKVQALGRAFAWHQQAKAVVAFQAAQGQIKVGKGGVDAAAKMQEIKAKIAEVETTRLKLDYDGTTKSLSKEVDTITQSINTINMLLHAPEEISLKSIYAAATPPEITDFVNDFSTGKIKFGDGVKDSVGLSDTDADYMIKNTYSMTSPEGGAIAAADNAKTRTTSERLYNEGITADGVAYRYTVEDGVITSLKEITDPAAMANTIKRLGGIYNIDAATVSKMGVENTRAINRTILFYRDNMPNLPVGVTFRCQPNRKKGVLGWIPTPGYPSLGNYAEYSFKIVNGRIEATAFPLYLGEAFYKKGQEESTKQVIKREVDNHGSPKNSYGLDNTPIHENGHATMARLAVARVNDKISAGKITVDAGMTTEKINALVYKEWQELHVELAKKAFDRIGIKYDEKTFEALWQQQADIISSYAGTSGIYHYETFSEAMVDVWANQDTASKFSVAIVEEMRIESQKYSMAASPRKALEANNIPYKANMFKGDEWNFPPSAKTRKQKAQWLAKHRADNPFIKKNGIMSTDDYIKANQWDTFFKKEIESYDASHKTSMPSKLVDKNGEYLENLAKNTARQLVEEIQKASIEGFDQKLAMIALGQNKDDVTQALNDFVISRINASAEKIAAKMDGGLTEENLNQARITLWQDKNVKADMHRLMSSLSAEMSPEDITKAVDLLFDEQAKGFASVEALSVDYKNLNAEYRKYKDELERSNKAAVAAGRKQDKKLKAEGYIDDTTQTIHYMDGGEDVYVVVNDPAVASILKNPNNYAEHGHTVSGLVATANTISRMYRIGTTGINPLALVRNVLRDPLQATITSGFNPLTMNLSPEVFYHTLRQYGLDDATIKSVTERLQNWAGQTSMTAALKQVGGETPGTAAYKSKAERFAKRTRNKVNIITDKLGAPMEAWETMFRNQIAQQSFTKAMKRTGGDIDKSMASAMFDASNATTDFSHAIGKFNNAISTVPYLSSAINGTASFWRLFNNDPLGMIGRITGGFIVPVMALTAWNLGSEERRKAYMNLPEWFRDGHIVMVDAEGNVYAVPIPDEISQFSGTARRLIEYTNDANQYSIPSILAQGAFGFAPVDLDGYFNSDGSLNLSRGTGQLFSTIAPQAATAIYEIAMQEKLYTGQDISDYTTLQKIINTLGNVFGSSATNIANDIGFICGASSKTIQGGTTMETLARDLFGTGFHDADNQFMELVGNPSSVDPETGKEKKATGLFAESEKIAKQLESLDKQVAFAHNDEERQKLYDQKEKLVEDFGNKVAGLVNNYMQLYSITGGLEDWRKKKLIQILGMGGAVSSASAGSYQEADASKADLDEWALGRQRYIDLGLPTNPTIEALTPNENGNLTNTLELQAAIDRFYGAPKQAAQDYKTAIEEAGLKDIKDEFYSAIEKIYDEAEAQGIDVDYDMIERIQARYLQSVDAVLVPIINKYGISILNNNDFINEVRSELGGMIPSDDWRQSVRNKKKFLSSKDYPLAAVDVKKWLQDRYQSGMRNRGLDSDQVVKDRIANVEGMIDRGERGKAKGEIESIMKGVDKANFYISSTDYQHLLELYNMVK